MSLQRNALSDVAATGNRLDTLRVLRDFLAGALERSQSDRDTAALSLRLMDVLAQIEAAEKAQPKTKGTTRDEVAEKRAGRKAAGARPRRTAQR